MSVCVTCAINKHVYIYVHIHIYIHTPIQYMYIKKIGGGGVVSVFLLSTGE